MIRTEKPPYFDEAGRTIIEHAVIEGEGPSRFFGIAKQHDGAGNVVAQMRFEIVAPTLQGAFANHDAAFAALKAEIERKQRQALLMQGAVNGGGRMVGR